MAAQPLKLAALPATLVVPACVVDAAETVVSSNDAFLALCGLRRGRRRGSRPLTACLRITEPRSKVDMVRRILSSRRPLKVAEITVETSKGQRRWVSLTGIPQAASGTSGRAALLIFHDLTQKKLDEELGRSRWGREAHVPPSLEEARRLLDEARKKIEMFQPEPRAPASPPNEALAAAHQSLSQAYSDMSEELDTARSIQEGLLPDRLPDALNVKSSALYIPAGKVGGDLYDMVITPQQKVAILIFDVSGHGIPAALIAAMAKMLFMHYIDRMESPAEVFTEVNRRMCKFVKSDHYLTAFLGILDPIENTLVYSKAGHVPPLVHHRATGEVTSLKARGFFIGHAALVDIARYSEETVRLEPGDKLFFYTDGLTEGANSDNEMYGLVRLTEAVRRHGTSSVAALLQRVLEDQTAFRAGTPLRDDFTMLCIETGSPDRFLAASGFSGEDRPAVMVVSSYKAMEEVAGTILREMDRNGFDDREIKRTKVCIFEMVTNAIEHGNKGDFAKKVVVASCITPEKAMISVMDEGDGFAHEHLPDPVLPENLLKDHGRGIYLLRRYMDELHFNEKGNRVLVVKYHREGTVPWK